LTYDPSVNALAAATVITGTVTSARRLSRFDLDLQPAMRVTRVVVNGAPAGFTHYRAELIITPVTALEPSSVLSVIITYDGHPSYIADGTTTGSGNGGWYRTRSGGAVAIGEPFSASAWYPVNEHPSDPAAFSVTATVPKKWSVISNGLKVTAGLPSPPAGMANFKWVQRVPIASYESMIYIDTFSTVTDSTVDGKPIVSAFTPNGKVDKFKRLAKDTRRILQVLSNHFGPYPFDAAGGIYTGEPLTFALETATRPVYADWVDTETIVHELSHQWYGDNVFIKRWSDICLNECFASYAPWLWHQDVDSADLDLRWRSEMAQVAGQPTFWASPLVAMGPGNEFSSVYSRGPLALHALRKQMGERAFAKLLKQWPTVNAGKTVTFAALEAFAGRLAHQNLVPFMSAWFRGRTVPPAEYLHPGGL